ncbi:MAG: PAS domain S-box protein [Natronomonas sp.]
MSDEIRVLYADRDGSVSHRLEDAFDTGDISLEIRTAREISEVIPSLEAEPIDCLVGGDRLEDGSGIDLVRSVRKRYPTLPVVLFTERCEGDLVREAVAADVTELLVRDPEDDQFSLLADRIERVVNRRRAVERTAELERVNAVVRELNRELVHASTRDEIDRRVCEVISNSTPYVFAWIGEHDADSKTITPRATAGVEAGYLGDVTITTDEGPTARGPTGTALRTHEMQVMQNIPEDPSYEPWRDQALQRGYRSSAAIPLVYDGVLYGVLSVYADRTEAFDSDERELLEELGETIARAHRDVLIQEESRRFQRAVDHAADAIFVTDVDGTIEYVNPAFEELTGYTRSEAVGQNPRILKSGELAAEYYEEMWETILSGETWQSEIINAKRSGERYVADQTVAPIEDRNGGIDGFVAIQRDVTHRKERTRELERYEHLWENLPVGVGRIDPTDEGKFLDVNERLVEIAGAPSAEALLETSIANLWVDQTKRPAFLEQIAEEGHATIEARFTRLDGTSFWGRVIAFGNANDETVIDVVIQDVTDRRQREIHLETAQEVANIGWWHKDFSSDQIFWSEQIYNMWGVEGNMGLIDHDVFLSFIHPDDRDDVDEQWEAAKAGEPYDVEHRIITGDGEIRWMREKAELTFDDTDEPVDAVGVVQDITDRKEREQELKARTEQYEAVIENVHDGLVIIQDELIQFANPRLTELSGYSSDELVGESMTKFVAEEYEDMVRERYRGRFESEEVTDTYEIEVQTRDGDRLPVELGVGVFTYEGEPATIVAIRDISERTDRTRQLRVLDRVLRHNLRNDMTTIQGYAETIRAEVDDVEEETTMILETSKKLMQTVDKEREIVEVIAEPPEQTDIDVADLCRRIADTASDAHSDAHIDLQLPEEASAVATRKLGRAIEELLDNAIVHSDRDTPEAAVVVESRGETVRILIEDDGPGIPEEEVNVLTREYDVAPLYHGSGLGLWLVNWIVRQSGGTLGFSENEPRGSVVTIELPRQV